MTTQPLTELQLSLLSTLADFPKFCASGAWHPESIEGGVPAIGWLESERVCERCGENGWRITALGRDVLSFAALDHRRLKKSVGMEVSRG